LNAPQPPTIANEDRRRSDLAKDGYAYGVDELRDNSDIVTA
jgi:hypothetical protein